MLSEEAFDDIERIQRATNRMQRLINDLLDLSRITRRGQPFQKTALGTVIREVIADLSYSYGNIHSRISLDGDMMIEADPNQVSQMMLQLLDNALKFHSPGKLSSVKIGIHPIAENNCQITVTDNGIGIKLEHLSKIFDIVARLHRSEEYPGTGVGLALVKKIVERHNGCITVESTSGEGWCFTVSLPNRQTIV